MSLPLSQSQQKSLNDPNQPLPPADSSWRKRFLRGFSLPIFLSSVAIAAGLWGIRQAGGLQFWELTAYDHQVRLASQIAPDPRLLIVGIDEEDIQTQQQGTLSDATVAQLLATLQKHQPAVIGLDIFRDIPHPPGEEQLAQVLKADNIIVPKQLPSADSQGTPPPEGIPLSRVGFIDLVIDPDNVVRRYFLYGESPDGKEQAYSFALQVVRHYLKKFPNKGDFQVLPDALKLDSVILPRLTATSGSYHLPPSEAQGWQVLMRYPSPQVARQISLEQALKGDFDPKWLKDKVVLIGYVAPSKKDTFPSPYSAVKTKDFEMAGVVIHGAMVSQLLSNVLDSEHQSWFWPQTVEFFWIWGWSVVGGIFVWRINRLVPLATVILITIGGIWGISFLLFVQGGWIPSVPPILGLVLTGAVVLADKAIYRSYHDPLTDLPNRRLFLKTLQQINQSAYLQQRNPITVLFLDIDRFNKVNAALGHTAGDYLLKVIAFRLRQLLDELSFLGRVGGDEFAICLRSGMNIQQINELVDQIHQEITEIVPWQDKEIRSTASIGIAYEQPGENFQATELLRYADIAMNHAKESGKDRHEMYVTGMDTEAVQRWELETDLWTAFKNQEFEMYYQPIISLKNRSIAGFEALIRWSSPKRGFVSPGEFIPVAEDTGLIIQLGEWILQESCRQMREWQEQFPRHRALMMSVNLSSRQFNQPNLVNQISNVLQQLGISAETLKLEITESHLMDDVEKAIELLKQLKGLGLRISIDDFGTGYSSLSYLHRFPIDTLKVDRSFVSRMDIGEEHSKYSQIVQTVISLGHNLDLDVIAEGIETPDQITMLQDLDCDYGQGYFFAKPLSKEAATELLKDPPQW